MVLGNTCRAPKIKQQCLEMDLKARMETRACPGTAAGAGRAGSRAEAAGQAGDRPARVGHPGGHPRLCGDREGGPTETPEETVRGRAAAAISERRHPRSEARLGLTEAEAQQRLPGWLRVRGTEFRPDGSGPGGSSPLPEGGSVTPMSEHRRSR